MLRMESYSVAFIEELANLVDKKGLNVEFIMTKEFKRSISALYVREESSEDIQYIRELTREVAKKLLELEPRLQEPKEFIVEIDNNPSSLVAYSLLVDTRKVPIVWNFNHYVLHRRRILPNKKYDLGKALFNHTFSEQYEMVVNDVFSILKEIGFEKLKDLSSEQKNEIIYRPITAAIISEIHDICGCNEDAVPYFMSQMIPDEDYYELRLGNKYDPFIKITAFNFKNTIGNKKLKQINLPTILQKVKMKESVTGRPSSTTMEIFMDNNWTAEFRFHANLISTKSFNIAMDIRLTSVPHDIESFIVELK